MDTDKLQNRRDIVSLLTMEDFTPVYEAADKVRRDNVGDTVHLRAIIEFSNICRRQCRYCGLNRDNRRLRRMRMTPEEIIATAHEAAAAGYRTIVLQSGEDEWFTAERLGDIIEEIKKMTVPVKSGEVIHPAVTVSCGEMAEEDYAYLRAKGADRYLLKHETADPELYDSLHPCGTLSRRIDCLKTIYRLGYEVGSGFMVGLPGQTMQTIADDLLLLKSIPCHMAGIGPFISNPKTALAGEENGDPETTRRAVAIARLLLPKVNLPVTTALSVLSEPAPAGKCTHTGEPAPTAKLAPAAKRTHDGKPASSIGDANPFAFGANVVMKKVTPDRYKEAYEIYPARFKQTDIAGDRKELETLIKGCGRKPL